MGPKCSVLAGLDQTDHYQTKKLPEKEKAHFAENSGTWASKIVD